MSLIKKNNKTKWPKELRKLTSEEQHIKDDFMYYWHEVLPQKYGMVEWFNQNYPVWQFRRCYYEREHWETLEIGGGRGSHIPFEREFVNQSYSVLELRDNMFQDLHSKYPEVIGRVGDAQKPFGENCYDRIVVIHVLEHLPDLPVALQNIKKALKKGGMAHVVIPCEGSLAYTLCRKISAERVFRKRYHRTYDFFVKTEHVNTVDEIMEELKKVFVISKIKYFPFPFIPLKLCNVVIGMELRIRTED